ncbi:hypothetical protein MRX96_056757 [Rhipicephalus microplus]
MRTLQLNLHGICPARDLFCDFVLQFAALADGVRESRSTHGTSLSECPRLCPPGAAPSLSVMAWSAPADRKEPQRVNACNSRARAGTLCSSAAVHARERFYACVRGASPYCDQPVVLLFLLAARGESLRFLPAGRRLS